MSIRSNFTRGIVTVTALGLSLSMVASACSSDTTRSAGPEGTNDGTLRTLAVYEGGGSESPGDDGNWNQLALAAGGKRIDLVSQKGVKFASVNLSEPIGDNWPTVGEPVASSCGTVDYTGSSATAAVRNLDQTLCFDINAVKWRSGLVWDIKTSAKQIAHDRPEPVPSPTDPSPTAPAPAPSPTEPSPTTPAPAPTATPTSASPRSSEGGASASPAFFVANPNVKQDVAAEQPGAGKKSEPDGSAETGFTAPLDSRAVFVSPSDFSSNKHELFVDFAQQYYNEHVKDTPGDYKTAVKNGWTPGEPQTTSTANSGDVLPFGQNLAKVDSTGAATTPFWTLDGAAANLESVGGQVVGWAPALNASRMPNGSLAAPIDTQISVPGTRSAVDVRGTFDQQLPVWAPVRDTQLVSTDTRGSGGAEGVSVVKSPTGQVLAIAVKPTAQTIMDWIRDPQSDTGTVSTTVFTPEGAQAAGIAVDSAANRIKVEYPTYANAPRDQTPAKLRKSFVRLGVSTERPAPNGQIRLPAIAPRQKLEVPIWTVGAIDTYCGDEAKNCSADHLWGIWSQGFFAYSAKKGTDSFDLTVSTNPGSGTACVSGISIVPGSNPIVREPGSSHCSPKPKTATGSAPQVSDGGVTGVSAVIFEPDPQWPPRDVCNKNRSGEVQCENYSTSFVVSSDHDPSLGGRMVVQVVPDAVNSVPASWKGVFPAATEKNQTKSGTPQWTMNRNFIDIGRSNNDVWEAPEDSFFDSESINPCAPVKDKDGAIIPNQPEELESVTRVKLRGTGETAYMAVYKDRELRRNGQDAVVCKRLAVGPKPPENLGSVEIKDGPDQPEDWRRGVVAHSGDGTPITGQAIFEGTLTCPVEYPYNWSYQVAPNSGWKTWEPSNAPARPTFAQKAAAIWSGLIVPIIDIWKSPTPLKGERNGTAVTPNELTASIDVSRADLPAYEVGTVQSQLSQDALVRGDKAEDKPSTSADTQPKMEGQINDKVAEIYSKKMKDIANSRQDAMMAIWDQFNKGQITEEQRNRLTENVDTTFEKKKKDAYNEAYKEGTKGRWDKIKDKGKSVIDFAKGAAKFIGYAGKAYKSVGKVIDFFSNLPAALAWKPAETKKYNLYTQDVPFNWSTAAVPTFDTPSERALWFVDVPDRFAYGKKVDDKYEVSPMAGNRGFTDGNGNIQPGFGDYAMAAYGVDGHVWLNCSTQPQAPSDIVPPPKDGSPKPSAPSSAESATTQQRRP